VGRGKILPFVFKPAQPPLARKPRACLARRTKQNYLDTNQARLLSGRYRLYQAQSGHTTIQAIWRLGALSQVFALTGRACRSGIPGGDKFVNEPGWER